MNTKHLLAIAAFAACGTSFAAPTVVNGGFEASTGNLTCASGWTCSGSSVFGEETASFWNSQYSGSNLTASANGGNVLATWSIDTPNWIQQTVSGLTAGTTYTLSFQSASADRYTTSAGTGTVGWQVSMGGSTLGTASVAIAGPTSATGWSTFSYSFVATGASEVLKFLSVSSVAVAPEPIMLLDGVNVVAAVPEPSTYALMGAGLLAVVSIARRRQKHAAQA